MTLRISMRPNMSAGSVTSYSLFAQLEREGETIVFGEQLDGGTVVSNEQLTALYRDVSPIELAFGCADKERVA